MKKLLVGLSVLTMLSATAHAGEWQILGPKALGMGGAHVAVSSDAHANYWNPAAYGFFGMNDQIKDDYSKRKWSAVASAGAGVQVHEDLGEQIDKLTAYDFDTLTDSTLQPSEVKDFIGLVNQLKEFNENNKRAVTILTDAGLSIQVGHFGVGVIGLGQISGKGDIDTVNIAPIGTVGTLTIDQFTNPANYGCSGGCPGDADNNGLLAAQKTELNTYFSTLGWTSTQSDNFINAVDNGLEASGMTASSDTISQIETTAAVATIAAGAGGSIDDNESSVNFKGQGIIEVPLTYGRAINNNLAIGGNLKFMKGRTYDVEVPAFDKDFSDLLDDAKDNYEESTAVGVDLAALYRMGDLRFGIVGRNLNSPKFDVKRYTYDFLNNVYNSPISVDITEDPQVRAGIAYKPLPILTLAADYDLTENDTTVSDDYKSRNIALGAELDLLKFLQLRAGMYKNLSENDMGNIYTAGLGLNLYLFNLDAGVSWASEKVTLDGDDYPKEVRGELALSMLF